MSRAFSTSIILHFIDLLTNGIYDLLKHGFFGRIFTGYSSCQRAFERGAVRSYFLGEKKPDTFWRRLRARISEAFENSFVTRLCASILSKAKAIPLKVYGNFFLSFGFYSLLAYFLRRLIYEISAWQFDELFVGAVMIVISFPLMLSKKNLGQALARGRLCKSLFVDILGFREDSFESESGRRAQKINFATLIGMLLGALGFFVSTLDIVLALCAVLLGALVISSPEIGVLLSIFTLPFTTLTPAPTLLIALLISASAVGYIIKLLRGKRILKIEIFDLCVIFFAVVMISAGIITSGGISSLYSALMSALLLLGYFLTVNLMRTKEWINRCVYAIVSSGTLVSLIGILQYLQGKAPLAWLDTSYFGDIDGRVTSLFDNPNVLAMYLVMVLPFILAATKSAQKRSSKVLGSLSALTVVICTVLTWSRGAWLAMIAILVIYGLINSRSTLKLLMALGFAAPLAAFFLPSSVLSRFMSIGDMSDSSTYYRVSCWRGTLDAIGDNFLGGIGYGSTSWAEIYPKYAYAGIEAAEHSHSLYLQILLTMGIFGLLMFLVAVFFFCQKNFEFFKRSDDRGDRLITSAAFVAVIGMMIMGLFDHVWYNYRIFYMFWCIIAISCASIRISDAQSVRQKFADESETTMGASIDI